MGILRVILALAVVFAHMGWPSTIVFVGGRNAVQAFYMVSGFVIAHVLSTVPAYQDRATFWASRALRLFPAYYVVLALSLLWRGFASSTAAGFTDLPLSAQLLVATTTVTLIGQDLVMFFTTVGGHLAVTSDFRSAAVPLYLGLPVPQAWTLGLELCFYLIAPWVVRSSKMLFLLLSISIISRLTAISLGFGTQDPWTYRFFPFELAFFLLGVISYRFLLPAYKRAGILSGATPCRLVTVGLVIFCAGYFLFPGREVIKTAVLFLAVGFALPFAFVFQQSNRFDAKIGELSFPIYISHILVIECLRSLGVQAHDLLTSAIYVASVIAFSIVLVFSLKPVETLRHLLRARGAANKTAQLDMHENAQPAPTIL